jgi:hypothetical protein
VQSKIAELLDELNEWANVALPEGARPESFQTPKAEREHCILSVHHWSTKILITRPCLCRLERRIEKESSNSFDFNGKIAEACVQAARALIKSFPDQPDLLFIYSRGPWWNLVHISKF